MATNAFLVTATNQDKKVLSAIPTSQLSLTRVETIPDSGVYDSANCTFNIANVGIPDAVSSDLTLEVAMLIMPAGAAQNDMYIIGVVINELSEQTATVTVGPSEPFPVTLLSISVAVSFTHSPREFRLILIEL